MEPRRRGRHARPNAFAQSPIVVHEDSTLYGLLNQLAATNRMVFFAGLPGTGKSLLIHQLAHLAHAAGRSVHLLQWDVARPVFETSRAAARYPALRGVTHALIRKAVGVWARHALIAWQQRYPDSRHVLIGETPFVGHRFVELARHLQDPAEPLLAAASCRFVIPVPSREVRRFLESERDRRMSRPRHDREREEAPPHVLRELWEQLVAAAPSLGIDPANTPGVREPYDPALYEHVYRLILKHRHVQTLRMETLLPNAAFSVYDFAFPKHDIVPAPKEAAGFIHAVEKEYPDLAKLQQEIDRWYIV